jgi:hypothetical protein
MPCPDPRCKDGWIRLPFPVLTTDHRGRPVVTDRVPCQECHGGTASCCDAAGSAQPHCGAAR